MIVAAQALIEAPFIQILIGLTVGSVAVIAFTKQ